MGTRHNLRVMAVVVLALIAGSNALLTSRAREALSAMVNKSSSNKQGGSSSTPQVAATTSAEPQYTFRYVVQDARTGDYKAQEERRDGGHVRGTYSVTEPNGDLRVVSYSTDGDSGFRAEVRVEPGGGISSDDGKSFPRLFPDAANLFRGPAMFTQQSVDTSMIPNFRPRLPDNPAASPITPASTMPLYHKPSTDTQLYQTSAIVTDSSGGMYQIPTYADYGKPIMSDANGGMYHNNAGGHLTDPSGVFQKPIMTDLNGAYTTGNGPNGYRPKLPETPAIPITPSPLQVAAPVRSPVFPPGFQMFRRPAVPPTPQPTLRPIPPRPTQYTQPMRVQQPTPTPNYPRPYPFIRYNPMYAFSPQLWQTNNPPFGYAFQGLQGMQGIQGPLMVVRTYLVPVPGRTPTMTPVTTITPVSTMNPVVTEVTSAPIEATPPSDSTPSVVVVSTEAPKV